MTPQEFIFEYLKADQDTGAGAYQRMISEIETLDWQAVKPHILKLRYFYFLKTSYWLIISNEVKRRSGWKCMSCLGRIGLQVHHEAEGNARHGEEHELLLGGLIRGLRCICDICHNKEHGPAKKIKEAEKKRQRNNRKENILVQLPYYPSKVSEENLSGSSVSLTRTLLEELEHEHHVVIERTLYEGWKVYKQ
jgi:hypothetical protein